MKEVAEFGKRQLTLRARIFLLIPCVMQEYFVQQRVRLVKVLLQLVLVLLGAPGDDLDNCVPIVGRGVETHIGHSVVNGRRNDHVHFMLLAILDRHLGEHLLLLLFLAKGLGFQPELAGLSNAERLLLPVAQHRSSDGVDLHLLLQLHNNLGTVRENLIDLGVRVAHLSSLAARDIHRQEKAPRRVRLLPVPGPTRRLPELVLLSGD
mmetsp:Transcript_22594/g.42467  ORF Transcript_22594/g.42467 Transcript_22594/m.42467 type:complete len:207 (-) Transcript_22594:121-741(-)